MSLSAANGAEAPVVLVVEDEFFVRLDISTCLREAGYVVMESASGEEAIAVCHRSAAMIDIVIIDINLGGPANGWDVAECFREEQPDTYRFSTCRRTRLIQNGVRPAASFSPSRFSAEKF